MSGVPKKHQGLSLARRRIGLTAMLALAVDLGIFAFVKGTSTGYEDWFQAALWLVPITATFVGLAIAYGIVVFCEVECRRNEAN